MNRFWGLVLAAGVLAGAVGSLRSGPAEGHLLIAMGDTFGYLAPCGCTKPMTGGIRRRAAAVRALTSGESATVLENGGFADGIGRQDRIKAEAMAEAVRHMGVDAVNLTPQESRLGMGLVLSLRNLAGEIFVQSNLRASETTAVQRFIPDGPFLVGGASSSHVQIARSLNESSVGNDAAASSLCEMARDAGLFPVLMLADGKEEAERLARAFPELSLIQYRSTGRPLAAPLRIGKTWLVSPGENGKHVLRLTFKDGEFRTYTPVELGPEFSDDPTVSRVYARYLARVDRENLLEDVPRKDSPAFAGTAACAPCHATEARIWKSSAHSYAQRTLIKEGHGRDPDCVGCHVVGLDKKTGFKSVQTTPQLANVGCESCHGPGAAHVKSKGARKLGQAGSRSCAPCHTPANSPGFEFDPYWRKIAH